MANQLSNNGEGQGRPACPECGPYRPLRQIGSGAHGQVWLADGPEGRVALKVCPRPSDPALLEDWRREMRGWSLFSAIPRHEALVRVFATGATADNCAFWVAMELADAEESDGAGNPDAYRPKTLASVADAEIALPFRDCLDIGLRLSAALEHLQRHHLLHRDIKPGNILYVRGMPVIADAGLVVDAREAASLVGTPGYVPPENHGSPQGDVFSLGKTLWRITTGRSPDDSSIAPCAEADTAEPLFGELIGILLRAMSSSPSKRFRSAKALRKALARLRRKMAREGLWRILKAFLIAFFIMAALAIGLAVGKGKFGEMAGLGQANGESRAGGERAAAQDEAGRSVFGGAPGIAADVSGLSDEELEAAAEKARKDAAEVVRATEKALDELLMNLNITNRSE